MRRSVRLAAFLAAAVTTVTLATPSIASAAVSIPNTNPFKVPSDALGHPVAFTISANGFAPGTSVVVEQCDGTPPTTPGWTPGVNCDLGSSPAAVQADSNGRVTFPAGDPNRQFIPFRGPGPQGQFNCLAALDVSPANGLPDWTNCQVRISSNNSVATADQQFFTIALPNGFKTSLGQCNGFNALGKYVAPSLSNTSQNVTLATSLLKDLSAVPPTALNGTCQVPGFTPPFATLHPKAFAAKFNGNASCLAAPQTGDYPLNGKLTITMNELNPTTLKPYQIQGYVRLAGTDPSAPDVVDVTGMLIKGPAAGAGILGSVAQAPVSKDVPQLKPKPAGYTGYHLDFAKLTNCQAGTPGAVVDMVQLTTGTSALGGYAAGIEFGF